MRAGNVTAFSAPYRADGQPHATYALGTAQVVRIGLRSGDRPRLGPLGRRHRATVTRAAGRRSTLDLTNASLHYIFAGSQSGPVALPLTGTGAYDVIGSHHARPTPRATSARSAARRSNANFTNRTVDAAVNIAIAGQTWNGTRERHADLSRPVLLGATRAAPIPGAPNPAPLTIGCSPSCGAGATGSFDGFFTGRTGQRAGHDVQPGRQPGRDRLRTPRRLSRAVDVR